MGGYGSGNYYRHGKKSTVEDCFTFGIGFFFRNGRLKSKASGSISWQDPMTDRIVGEVGYRLAPAGEFSVKLMLEYFIPCVGEVSQSIPLQTTEPHFGGIRWWLTCPLRCGDGLCGRRVSKLHMRYLYFGCRDCLELAYRSSQEAHHAERFRKSLPKSIARGNEMIRRREQMRSRGTTAN